MKKKTIKIFGIGAVVLFILIVFTSVASARALELPCTISLPDAYSERFYIDTWYEFLIVSIGWFIDENGRFYEKGIYWDFPL